MVHPCLSCSLSSFDCSSTSSQSMWHSNPHHKIDTVKLNGGFQSHSTPSHPFRVPPFSETPMVIPHGFPHRHDQLQHQVELMRQVLRICQNHGDITGMRWDMYTYISIYLIGGWALPLWKMMDFVSWDYELPNIWKIIKFHGSKPPTSISYVMIEYDRYCRNDVAPA